MGRSVFIDPYSVSSFQFDGCLEFDFSVVDEEIAKTLMISGGKNVQLHYKEYFGALPWRGYTKFVVDSIVYIEELNEPSISEELAPYILESM